MKKTTAFVALAIFVINVFCVSCQKEPGGSKSYYYEYAYSIFFPAMHSQTKIAQRWADEISQRTNGRVKINLFPGGILTNANECYDGVVRGISDLGMSCFSYTRGRFPVMEAADLPLGYPNGMTATMAANEYYKIMAPDELKHVKVLYLHAHGPGLLHTKMPVKTLKELKGLKIRSTGLSASVIEVLGGIPIAMSQGATYESLQRGVVEGTFTPIETLKDWRQAEVVKYTTNCLSVGYTTAMFVVMNIKKWNALPNDIKTVFEEVSTEWIPMHGLAWDTSDAEAREYVKSLGNEILELSPSESDRWAKAVEPVIANYIKDSYKKNLPGSESVDTLRKLIVKYGKQR